MKLRGDRCQCGKCELYFNSTAAFDAHRTGKNEDRRCMSIEEMQARGMAQKDDGFWVTKLGGNYWAAQPENAILA